jgi:hypothetical protein
MALSGCKRKKTLHRFSVSASETANLAFTPLVLRNPLVYLLQLTVKARLAHSACFAAVASREMVTAGWTIELRVSGYVAIWHGGCFRPTLDALLTDDVVTSDAESGHQRLYLA